MPGLHSCLVSGLRVTAPTPTPASLRSPTFFLGAKASGRLGVYTQGKQGSDCRGNAQKSELGKLAAFQLHCSEEMSNPAGHLGGKHPASVRPKTSMISLAARPYSPQGQQVCPAPAKSLVTEASELFGRSWSDPDGSARHNDGPRVDSMLLETINGITRFLKSLRFHATNGSVCPDYFVARLPPPAIPPLVQHLLPAYTTQIVRLR